MRPGKGKIGQTVAAARIPTVAHEGPDGGRTFQVACP